jgi:hypothetical protein
MSRQLLMWRSFICPLTHKPKSPSGWQRGLSFHSLKTLQIPLLDRGGGAQRRPLTNATLVERPWEFIRFLREAAASGHSFFRFNGNDSFAF